MVMKPALLAAAGVIAMLIGYAGGRATAPTKTVEKVVTVEKTVEVAAKTKEVTSAEATKADIRSVTHWRVRYVAKPDGTVVTTASGDSGESTEKTTHHEATDRQAEVRYVDREKLVEKVVTKEAYRPSWSVALGAGLRRGPEAVYRGEVARRLVGPLWLGAYGSTAAEFGLVARVEW